MGLGKIKMLVVSCPKVNHPEVSRLRLFSEYSNQDCGMTSTLIFLISSLDFDSTTTLKFYFSCSNFSSTSLSFSRFEHYFHIQTSSNSFLLQHYFYQGNFNYEILNWNFELGRLFCVVPEAESNQEGVLFIEGEVAGQTA